MRSKELELSTEEELLLAKKNRVASRLSGDNINELVEKINDYSVYNLFEPIMLMISCNEGCGYLGKRDEDSSVLDEENICRRKVYHLLKDSGYDDFYIEDNIEKYTELLLNFYSNPDRIIKIFDLYNIPLNNEIDKKVRIRKIG